MKERLDAFFIEKIVSRHCGLGNILLVGKCLENAARILVRRGLNVHLLVGDKRAQEEFDELCADVAVTGLGSTPPFLDQSFDTVVVSNDMLEGGTVPVSEILPLSRMSVLIVGPLSPEFRHLLIVTAFHKGYGYGANALGQELSQPKAQALLLQRGGVGSRDSDAIKDPNAFGARLDFIQRLTTAFPTGLASKLATIQLLTMEGKEEDTWAPPPHLLAMLTGSTVDSRHFSAPPSSSPSSVAIAWNPPLKDFGETISHIHKGLTDDIGASIFVVVEAQSPSSDPVATLRTVIETRVEGLWVESVSLIGEAAASRSFGPIRFREDGAVFGYLPIDWNEEHNGKSWWVVRFACLRGLDHAAHTDMRNFERCFVMVGQRPYRSLAAMTHLAEKIIDITPETPQPYEFIKLCMVLCAFGYTLLMSRSMRRSQAEKVLSMIERAESSSVFILYNPEETAFLELVRWKLSIKFLKGQLALAAGHRAKARDAFASCRIAGRDILLPYLRHRIVLGLLMAGRIAYADGDRKSARRYWEDGYAEFTHFVEALNRSRGIHSNQFQENATVMMAGAVLMEHIRSLDTPLDAVPFTRSFNITHATMIDFIPVDRYGEQLLLSEDEYILPSEMGPYQSGTEGSVVRPQSQFSFPLREAAELVAQTLSRALCIKMEGDDIEGRDLLRIIQHRTVWVRNANHDYSMNWHGTGLVLVPNKPEEPAISILIPHAIGAETRSIVATVHLAHARSADVIFRIRVLDRTGMIVGVAEERLVANEERNLTLMLPDGHDGEAVELTNVMAEANQVNHFAWAKWKTLAARFES